MMHKHTQLKNENNLIFFKRVMIIVIVIVITSVVNHLGSSPQRKFRVFREKPLGRQEVMSHMLALCGMTEPFQGLAPQL